MVETLLTLVMYLCAPTSSPGVCEQTIYPCAQYRIEKDHEKMGRALQWCWLKAETEELYE